MLETEEKLNFSSLPFLHDHQLLNVPNYFLHESHDWTYHSSEVETGPYLFLICGIFFFYLDSNSSTPCEVQGFVVPLGFPAHYSAGHICRCSVTKSCLTLCNPMDSTLQGSCLWNSPGKNTGVGCHSLFQRIFLTQGSNLSLLHCRWILYHLSHQGSPQGKLKELRTGSGHVSPV